MSSETLTFCHFCDVELDESEAWTFPDFGPACEECAGYVTRTLVLRSQELSPKPLTVAIDALIRAALWNEDAKVAQGAFETLETLFARFREVGLEFDVAAGAFAEVDR